jgi:AcrR family transcriptional regulator
MSDLNQYYRDLLDGYAKDMEGYTAFRKVGQAKQQQILDAAMQEFADFGYSGASTNRIVSKAGISKGLLFHYFGDKQGLCLYLWAHGISLLYRDVRLLLDLNNKDIFDVLKQAIVSKMAVAFEHPLESRFTVSMLAGDVPEAIKQRISTVFSNSFDMVTLLANQLDPKLLKDGLDKDISAKIIEWVMTGVSNQILASIRPDEVMENYQQISDDAEQYLRFLRELLYK